LDFLNLRLMLKISCAGCLGLSLAILTRFTLKMCVAARNHEKFTKTPYVGSSRSFKVIDVDKIKKLVTVTSAVMISNMFVPIYNRFYTVQQCDGQTDAHAGHG